MNKRFITLQMLGLSLAGFSQLAAMEENHQAGHVAASAAETSEQERQAVIERLSQGMSEYCKDRVITAVASVPAERLTVFEATVNNLSQGIDEYCKTTLFATVAKIPAECLTPAFINTVNNFSQGMDGYEKINVIKAVANVPTYRLTPEFEATVNNFSQGMDENYKSSVIAAVASVHTFFLTPEFEATVNNLSQGMNGNDKIDVIKAVAKIPAERFKAFEVTVSSFSQGMNGNEKSYLITTVANVPAELLTSEFEATVNNLSQGMNGHGKSTVIAAVSKVPAERLKAFEDTANNLSQGMNGHDKSHVIYCVANIPTECLTPAFEAAANNLSQEMNGEDKCTVIYCIVNIPAECLTPAFINTVNNFSQGMNGHDKSSMITAVSKVPAKHLDALKIAVNNLYQGTNVYNKNQVITVVLNMAIERLTPQFIDAVNRLSGRMDEYYKSRMIENVSKIAAENLTALNNTFTDQILQQLRFVPDDKRVELVSRLATMEANQWQAEITQTIDQYRPHIVMVPLLHEVHNYASTQVTANSSSNSASPSSSSSSRSPSPTRLDDAVIENMNQRLQQSGIDPIAFADAKMLLEQWIETKYSNSSASSSELESAKDAAFAKLVSDTDYEQVISTAVSFLQKFHSDKLDLWLDGFLGESIKANSCNKGIKERVATGMRNIDPELDELFAQAEGPALVNKFMGNLNLSDKNRCKTITEELIKLGLNANSTAAEAGEIFERYIRNWFTESGVSADKYLSDIQTMKELVEEFGGFEKYIKPILKKPA